MTDPWAPASPDAPSRESWPARLLGWVVGFLLGVLFGLLGTVVSQSTVSFFGLFPLPIGLIVALPAIALLLIGLRTVQRTRTTAILAALGIVCTILMLSQRSTGGSVLVPENALGWTWTLAPTLIALVVLAWPRARA